MNRALARHRRWGHAAGPATRVIDFHAHFVPDFYRDAAAGAGYGDPDGIADFPATASSPAAQAGNRIVDVTPAHTAGRQPGSRAGQPVPEGKQEKEERKKQ
jgi:hypothetical protein